MDFRDHVVVGLTYEESPGCLPGLFRIFVGLEWVDSAAEFVGQFWFGVACEESVVDYFAELGEPVA